MNPERTLSTMICSLLAAILLLVSLVWISSIVLAKATSVEVVVQLDHPDRLQLFHSDGRDFSKRSSVFSQPLEPNVRQTAVFVLKHVPLAKARLDVGRIPGTVRIYGLTAKGLFSGPVVLTPADVLRLFSVHSANTPVRLEQDHVEIRSHEDSYIVCNQPLLKPPRMLLFGLPLLLSLVLLAVLWQTDFSRLPPFADLRGKRPSTGENINVLDGLRGIAVLMVVADHTWTWFTGVGTSGVWIFMTLSGFLLAKPFVQQPDRAVSASFLKRFFLRRAWRIMPVYYAYVLAIFLFNGHFDDALLHVLFLKGSGHLWVVPQEMLFYFLTPPVMLAILLLFGGRPLPAVLFLTALLLCCNHFLDEDVLSLYGGPGDIAIRPYFGIFLGGIAASWLHHGIWLKIDRPGLHGRIEPWAASLVVGLLLFLILFSHEWKWGGQRLLAHLYFPWFGGAAAMLILSALAAGQSVVVRFLSCLPLRALSLVSYSIYLVHPLVIGVFRKGSEHFFGTALSDFPLFASTLLTSYLLACVSYSLIERPFLRLS